MVVAVVEIEVAVGREICDLQTQLWSKTQATPGRRQDVEAEAHVAQSPDFGPEHKNWDGDEKVLGHEGGLAEPQEVKVVLSHNVTPSVTLQVTLPAKEAPVALHHPV